MGSYIVPPLYIPPPPGLHVSGPVGMPVSYPMYYQQQPANMVYNVNMAPPMPAGYPYAPAYPASYPMQQQPSQPAFQQQPAPQAPLIPEFPKQNANPLAMQQPGGEGAIPDALEKAFRKQATQQVQTGLQAFFRGVTVASLPVGLLSVYMLLQGRYTDMATALKTIRSTAIMCATSLAAAGGLSAGWAYKDVGKALLNNWFIKPATGVNMLTTSNGLTGAANVPQLPPQFKL